MKPLLNNELIFDREKNDRLPFSCPCHKVAEAHSAMKCSLLDHTVNLLF